MKSHTVLLIVFSWEHEYYNTYIWTCQHCWTDEIQSHNLKLYRIIYPAIMIYNYLFWGSVITRTFDLISTKFTCNMFVIAVDIFVVVVVARNKSCILVKYISTKLTQTHSLHLIFMYSYVSHAIAKANRIIFTIYIHFID